MGDSRNAAAYDVLIVGCGPVGALLANLLGRDGLRAAVFEREREIYRLPRAVHFDGEIMRAFQSVGLRESDLPDTAAVRGYEFWTAEREVFLRFPLGQATTVHGWRQDYMFHQPALDAALRAAVSERSSIDVFLEREVVGLTEHPDRVELAVRDLRDGSVTRVAAPYVVACDGANSGVRKLAGLGLEDLAFDEPWLVLDAKIAKPVAELGLPETPVQLCDPARPTSFIPVAGPYVRWEFMLLPGESADAMTRPEQVQRLLAEWTDPAGLEVIRTAVYDFHALIALRWNTERIFLAGDAAHQMPPFLGQGLCAGVRDAVNLAWKLERVLRGAAPAAILASYQQERSPHVRQIIEIAVGLGRIICTQDPAAARQRDEQFRARGSVDQAMPPFPWLHDGLLQRRREGPGGDLVGRPGLQARVETADGSVQRLDDVVGPGFALLVFSEAAPQLDAAARRALTAARGRVAWILPAAAAAGSPPSALRVRDIDGAYARWFEQHACTTALVRPDRYVFGAGAGPDAPANLLAELAQQLGTKAGKAGT